jgi:hypothetical protein
MHRTGHCTGSSHIHRDEIPGGSPPFDLFPRKLYSASEVVDGEQVLLWNVMRWLVGL